MNKVLGSHFLYLCFINVLFHFLLAQNISVKKSDNNLIFFPLYVTQSFCLEAQEMFFLLKSKTFIKKHLSVGHFKLTFSSRCGTLPVYHFFLISVKISWIVLFDIYLLAVGFFLGDSVIALMFLTCLPAFSFSL